MYLSDGAFMANFSQVERQWKPVEAVPREQKDHCSKAGVLRGLEELLSCRQLPALPLPVSAFHQKFLTCHC